MKLALAIIVLVVFVLSLVADYKWRQWMTNRRSDRNATDASSPDHPHQTR